MYVATPSSRALARFWNLSATALYIHTDRAFASTGVHTEAGPTTAARRPAKEVERCSLIRIEPVAYRRAAQHSGPGERIRAYHKQARIMIRV